jgi:hypothetical protein
MSKSEKEFKEYMLKTIGEILEETHQVSDDSCPFCCQPEYPVDEDGEEMGLGEDCSEAEEWRIDHYDDCLITILEKQHTKIQKYGVWY